MRSKVTKQKPTKTHEAKRISLNKSTAKKKPTKLQPPPRDTESQYDFLHNSALYRTGRSDSSSSFGSDTRFAMTHSGESELEQTDSNVTNRTANTTRNRSSTSRVNNSRRKQSTPKKRRRRDHVLKEIRKFQKTTHNLMPRAPFQRYAGLFINFTVSSYILYILWSAFLFSFSCNQKTLKNLLLTFFRCVREALCMYKTDWRVTPQALMALQESCETYLVQLLEDSYICTLHRNRLTLAVKDMYLVKYLRGPRDPGNP